MAILEELYNGNINPSEKYIKRGSEYHELNVELVEQIEEFTQALTDAQKQKYEKIIEGIYGLNAIIEHERFEDGFCLGAKLILEIIGYESKNLI